MITAAMQPGTRYAPGVTPCCRYPARFRAVMKPQSLLACSWGTKPVTCWHFNPACHAVSSCTLP